MTGAPTKLFQIPWITLVVSAAVLLLPPGNDILRAAILYQATDWLRDLWVMVTLIAFAVMFGLAMLEWYLRRRIMRRKALSLVQNPLPDA